MHTETVNTTTGEYVNMSDFNLSDVPAIPDLSGIGEDAATSEPWADGWYEGTIVEKREFTDNNGNDRVFASEDAPSQKSGRNVRLQVVVKRRSDGRVLNTSTIVNYRPEDLTTETIQAVAKRREESKSNGDNMGDLFRPFITLTRLGKLQKIAGVRQFQRNGGGGMDLSSLYGKTAFFRLGEDSRNPQYREIKDYRVDPPKKATVL